MSPLSFTGVVAVSPAAVHRGECAVAGHVGWQRAVPLVSAGHEHHQGTLAWFGCVCGDPARKWPSPADGDGRQVLATGQHAGACNPSVLARNVRLCAACVERKPAGHDSGQVLLALPPLPTPVSPSPVAAVQMLVVYSPYNVLTIGVSQLWPKRGDFADMWFHQVRGHISSCLCCWC